MATKELEFEAEACLQLTTSIGVAARKKAELLDLSSLIKQADKALYRAKAAGRNQVQG